MTRRQGLLLALAVLALLVAGTGVLALTSPHFDLSWHVLGGGGGQLASASYRVDGTVGQAVASPPLAASPHFVLSSGYWYSQAPPPPRIYLPMILRS